MGKILSSLLCAAILVFSFNAQAAGFKCGAGIKIDARNAPYSTLTAVNGQHVGINDILELRSEVMTAVAGEYRFRRPPGALPAGSLFKMIYRDGSRECAVVATTSSSLGAVPVPNTARPNPGGTLEVESTALYIQQFQRPGPNVSGWYRVCYDYYSDGEVTATECHIEPF
jgi:hypothetical protein